jgi:hypothetical protein
MTNKQLDQFQADFFLLEDEISVNCRWLQNLLREKNSKTAIISAELTKANLTIGLLQSKISRLESDMPKYRLDVRV